MYRSFYHLNKKPFHITPDPEFLFLSPSHGEAFAAIIYGIEHRKGFLAITGEVGVGKTTILRAYLEKTGHEQHRIIYIFNAAVSFSGLLRLVLEEFGVAVAGDDTFAMVNRLHHLLIEEYQNNRNVVLIIDEAQNMPVETLEHLRMLSNLETSEDKLLQIVLVGQPELDRLLDLHELRQLRQRIAVRCRIKALTEAESHAYIQHRLAKASAHGGVIFAPGSLQPIIREAAGVPRIINILCDNALLTGFGYQQKPITKKIVKEVVAEHRGTKHRWHRRWWLAPFAVAAVAGVVLFAGFSPLFSHSTSLGNLPGWGEFRSLLLPLTGLKGGTQQPTNEPAPPPASVEGPASPAPVEAVPPSPVQQQNLSQESTPGKGQPLSAETPDKREGPLSAISPANDPASAPVTAPTEEQALSPPPPASAASISWNDNRVLHLTAQPSPLTPDASPLTAHASPLTPDASPLTAHASPLTATVKEGDCFVHLVREVYGYADKKLIQTVRDYNPHIKDINLIKTGDLIAFPPADRMKARPE